MSRTRTEIGNAAILTRKGIERESNLLQTKLLPSIAIRDYAKNSHIAAADGEKINDLYDKFLDHLLKKPDTTKNKLERADTYYEYADHLSMLRIYYYYCYKQAESNEDKQKYLNLASLQSQKSRTQIESSFHLYSDPTDRDGTKTLWDEFEHCDQIIQADLASLNMSIKGCYEKGAKQNKPITEAADISTSCNRHGSLGRVTGRSDRVRTNQRRSCQQTQIEDDEVTSEDEDSAPEVQEINSYPNILELLAKNDVNKLSDDSHRLIPQSAASQLVSHPAQHFDNHYKGPPLGVSTMFEFDVLSPLTTNSSSISGTFSFDGHHGLASVKQENKESGSAFGNYHPSALMQQLMGNSIAVDSEEDDQEKSLPLKKRRKYFAKSKSINARDSESKKTEEPSSDSVVTFKATT